MSLPKHIRDAMEKQEVFYHVSHDPLPVGDIIFSRGSKARTPSLVEAMRPEGVLPREAHLFMVRNPKCLGNLGQDVSAQYAYEVTPEAPVLKTNFGQIERVYEIAADSDDYKSDKRAIRAAKSYWEGKRVRGLPCRDEYLTMAFRVDREVPL